MLTGHNRVTARIGNINLGVCVAKEGGMIDSEEVKSRLGNMSPQIAFGGPQTVENVTIRKHFDPALRAQLKRLEAGVGKAACVINVQPLDQNGAPQGASQVYTGILKSVNPPPADDNTADVAWLELEVSTHSKIG